MSTNATIDDRLTDFRARRTAMVREGEFADLAKTARAFLVHILPEESSNVSEAIVRNVSQLRTAVPPIGVGSWDYCFNVDGYLVHGRSYSTEGIASYVQWLRLGSVEFYSGDLVTEPDAQRDIPMPALAGGVLSRYFQVELPQAVAILRGGLGVAGPLTVSASLVGMRGVRVALGDWRFDTGPGIDRDVVTTPWVAIPDGGDPTAPLRAVGDILWQSAGHAAMPLAAR